MTDCLSGADNTRVYSILGGTPLYQRQWNAELDVRTSLLALFGDQTPQVRSSIMCGTHREVV